MNNHWTGRSTEDFVYRISSDFALQIEKKMDEGPVTQSSLAERLGVTPGRVSQVLRNPGNLTLRKMVEYAASLGMKVSVIAYEDGDTQNQNGPINSEIFNACWIKAGKPNDFFALKPAFEVVQNTPSIHYLSPVLYLGEDQTSETNTMLMPLVLQHRKNTTRHSKYAGAI
jgi:transcriptional regulator with XRE-family HTH domain